MAKDITLMCASGCASCWSVMLALEEKNLSGYNYILLSFQKNEHKSKEVMDINPRGWLPAFKHGDNIVNEPLGICLYLESVFKSNGNQLIPDHEAEQAIVYQRLLESDVLAEKIGAVFFYNSRTPVEERTAVGVEKVRAALTAELKLWDSYMQKKSGRFLAGKTFTLADVAVFPCMAALFQYGLPQGNYPQIAAYYNDLKDRSSIEATWPSYWPDPPKGTESLQHI